MTDRRSEATPKTVFLKDYAPPAYRVDTVDLIFTLGEEETVVRSRLTLRRDDAVPADTPLILDGHDLILRALTLDGKAVDTTRYVLTDTSLTVLSVPARCVLELDTAIFPHNNTSLEGLYKSSGNFCTQCEAQGFRKITYFPDRPDVMARYSTTLIADRERYPVILSNGNRVAQGVYPDGRHWARWEDPFPKPCYLFALVAGDLVCLEDHFVTCSGRRVTLQIYVQSHNADQCDHAMASLKKAMAWDEQAYGREYDLDTYMIVAVDDFNMGAMENKGLNIFNSKFVLAKQDTATDADYQQIEGVIGHEYFHNWSGNRVTCRDWFQLSLKEGFTVFRDQEFSADVNSRGVKRIADVNVLRTHQFREDAGPMAHPVRPDSYVEINNFYTATVYNKGAEVVRMLSLLLGASGFRKGADLYFARHDGHAVTTDDFVKAMEDANSVDLTQFKRWYSQGGTPVVTVRGQYDAPRQTYTLQVTQSCPATPGQPTKLPFVIPLAVGLLGSDGRDMVSPGGGPQAKVLHVTQESQHFEFSQVKERPIPSILRGFSAPVRLQSDLSDTDRLFLMAHDTDPYNRWDSGQQLLTRCIMDLAQRIQTGRELSMDEPLLEAMRKVLRSDNQDQAVAAMAMLLPTEHYLAEFMDVIDPGAIHQACRYVRRRLAEVLEDDLVAVYSANAEQGAFSIDPVAMGRRSLKNVCLGYLMELDDVAYRDMGLRQFASAPTMTDCLAALIFLANGNWNERLEALRVFHERWQDDALVMDKWLAIQATSRRGDTLATVLKLLEHPAFDIKNPNKVRSLIGAFCQMNPARFHAPDGAGYHFLAEQVLRLDALNPQIAARLVSAFTLWRKYTPDRAQQMQAQLQRIMAVPTISKDVYEIVSKSLA